MNLFNPKYVYALYTRELEGQKCVVSDDVEQLSRELKGKVAHDDAITVRTIRKNPNFNYKIYDDVGVHWNYAYYDPRLNVKLAFYEGKRIGYSMDKVCPDPPDEILHKDNAGDEEKLFYVLDCLKPKSVVILDVKQESKSTVILDIKQELKWTDLKLGDKVKCFNGEHCGDEGIVTYIDVNPNCFVHMLVGACWLSDDDLKNWEKVKDD